MGEINIEVDLELYSLDVIFSASYTLLDKGYFFLEKKVKKEGKDMIIVLISSKDEAKISSDELKGEFLDQLINYSVYYSQLKETRETKEKILNEVFAHSLKKEIPKKEDIFNLEESIDDPEGILIPWEDKYKEKKSE